MLLLLPPSEGKASPADGPALDLRALSFPELNRTRRTAIRDIATLCRTDPDAARRALKLGPSQDDALADDRRLSRSPTLAARDLYTGVLYEALGLTSLPPAAEVVADDAVVILSGLWGAVRPADRLPRYKLPMGTPLGGQALRARWRAALDRPLHAAAGGGLVVDLRSAPYAAAWRPRPDLALRTVTVSVLAETVVDGRRVRTPVSHFNKTAKGRLARALLLDPTDDLAALPARAAAAGLLGELDRTGPTPRLDLVEPAP